MVKNVRKFLSLILLATLFSCSGEVTYVTSIPVTGSNLNLTIFKTRNALLRCEVALNRYLLKKSSFPKAARQQALSDLKDGLTALIELKPDSKEILTIVNEYKEWQGKVEAIAHKIDNTPALALFHKELNLFAVERRKHLGALLNVEKTLEDNKKRKTLVLAIAEQQRSFEASHQNLRSYLITEKGQYEKLSDVAAAENQKNLIHLQYRGGGHYLFTNVQKPHYKKFIAARKSYLIYRVRVLQIQNGKHPNLLPNLTRAWMQEELAPRFKKIDNFLIEMLESDK
jgi:hypothetical protein